MGALTEAVLSESFMRNVTLGLAITPPLRALSTRPANVHGVHQRQKNIDSAYLIARLQPSPEPHRTSFEPAGKM